MTIKADQRTLIGRERESSVLIRAADAARNGRGALFLLSGDAGIDKTSLVRQIIANSGLHMLEGRAYQGVTLPYGPLATVLRAQQIDLSTMLADATAAEHLALVLPELGAPPEDSDQAALFEALRSTLATLARQQPSALFLDDLHWADHATLELLPALAGALEHEPILIVGAYRSDEIPRGHPIRRMRADLRRSGRMRELMIEPLDQQQTAQLAARVLGDEPGPALAAALYDRTEGIPFFVEEFATTLQATGRLRREADGLVLHASDSLPLPESVRDVVGLQVDGFPDQARSVLQIAAVAGQEFDLNLVSTLAGDDEPGLVALLDRGFLVELSEDRAAFRHALTREACYLDTSLSRRRALHREVAAYLASHDAPAAIVAEHWLAGREPELARKALISAAKSSCRLHAYRDANATFRRALDLWPDGEDEARRRDLLERQASCAELSGDLAEASRAWRDASEAHRQAGETGRLAITERRLAGIYELRGDWERALTARRNAAEAFTRTDQPGESASELLLAAAHLRTATNYQQALEMAELATPDIDRSGRIDLRARRLALVGNIHTRLGDSEGGMALVQAGLTLALEHNLAAPAASIYQLMADALEHTGDYTTAKETYLQAFAYCQTNAAETTAYICLACLSVVLRQTGEWSRATEFCRDVLASPNHPVHARAAAGGTLGTIYALRGDVRSARPLLTETSALVQRIELVAMEMLIIWSMALIDDLNGAHDDGIARCEALLERWEQTEERHYVVPAFRWAVTYCAEHQASQQARACTAALARIATSTGQPEALSALAHALGETALLDGDIEQAINQFQQSLDLIRDQQLPLEVAQTERRLGNALARADQRGAAIARLTVAYRAARKLGARPLAAAIARDLKALGEPIERRLGRRAAGQLANGGLSPRELEVMRLVALGRTSREIGQQLFISPRTVEMHVQSILAKLDCRSRAEATRKAAELGLLQPVEARA